MYQIELGNVDWERDWTHRGLKAVYVHFLDCVFNYKRRVYYYQGRSEEEDQDEWAGKVPDRGMMKKQYVDARRFLRDCIVDKPQRGALFNAIFRDDGSLRDNGHLSRENYGGECTSECMHELLDILSDIEHIWKSCSVYQRGCYLRLLIGLGTLESLNKANLLSKKEGSTSLSDLRRLALVELYKKHPLSFHPEDPEYFRRKLEEMQSMKGSNAESLLRFADIIYLLRDGGWLDKDSFSSRGGRERDKRRFGDDVMIEIAVRINQYGEFGDTPEYGRNRKDLKPIWDSLRKTLVYFFDFHRARRLPTEVCEAMGRLGMNKPKYYYEDLILQAPFFKRMRVAMKMRINYDPGQALDLEGFSEMSKDPDRRVRMVIARKLGEGRGYIEKKHKPYLEGGSGMVKTKSEVSDVQLPIELILREMLEGDEVNKLEKRLSWSPLGWIIMTSSCNARRGPLP